MPAQDVLVSTDWVAQHANDPGVKLIEVDVDTNAYEEGHIPGAAGFNWTSQLQDQVRRDVITKTELEKLLGEAGVSNSDTIVFYGDNNNWFAAYAFWVLEMYGHRDLKLMDGGRKKWLDENRPTTKDKPQPAASTYTASEPNTAIRAKREEVLQAMGRSAMVDVRSPAEFTGEILAPPGLQETAQRGGHIPGAANIPWGQAVKEDGTFKSIEDLKALYEGKGVTPDKDVIAYCRIGERSSHSWFALKHMVDVPVEKP
jgi:thiosulfate/3-mercaptopyruvate sulfurtransferase